MQPKLFTLCMALYAVCLNATSQNVPDYVPPDGLVAWYPFNGNANDESGNGNNGQNNGVSFGTDRFGTVNSAGSFNGVSSYVNGSLVGLNNPSEITLSIWLLSQGDAGGQPYDLFFQLGNYGQHTFAYAYNHSGTNIDLHSNCFYNPYSSLDINDEWHHLVIVSGVGTASFYVDGELFVNMNSANWGGGCYLGSNAFYIGGGADNQYTTGLIDEVGFWDRALTEAEIEALYTVEIPISGCTDETACNFDSEATSDDDSCVPSGCMEAEACNYSALAECEGEACDYSCCPGPGCCGEGMYWDYEFEQCMVSETCQEDLDGDGVIGVNDLMQLLSVYATDCEAEDVDPELGEFTCGDPMSYHGYDYATVLIGEQCWFAENLRNQKYANGDLIPDNLDDVQWSSTDFGATSIYGEDSSDCYGPCDEIENLDWHGRLYNFEAIQDPRGLCPSGWSPPSETDVLDLIGYYGGVTLAGPDLAAEGAWGVGTGESGLDVVPQGWRNPSGYFSLSGDFYLWTSTEGLPNESSFLRVAYQGSILVDQISHWFGMSARCLKDTEE